jgi:hypothetical protein
MFYFRKRDRIRIEYTPEVIGWKMANSIRAKDMDEKYKTHHNMIFYVDNELSNIIKSPTLSLSPGKKIWLYFNK